MASRHTAPACVTCTDERASPRAFALLHRRGVRERGTPRDSTRRRQSAGLNLISTSSKTPTLPPHFLVGPAALTEPKQTIRRDYYEQDKRKGLVSRFFFPPPANGLNVPFVLLNPGN